MKANNFFLLELWHGTEGACTKIKYYDDFIERSLVCIYAKRIMLTLHYKKASCIGYTERLQRSILNLIIMRLDSKSKNETYPLDNITY